MITSIIDADRRLFYKLYHQYRLSPYKAAVLAWIKGVAMGAIVTAILL